MKRNSMLLIFLSALLLALSRLPLQLGFLVFWSFIPLFHFFQNKYRTKHLLAYGFIFSFVYTVISLHWINLVTIPGFLGMIIVFGFYFFLIFWLSNRIWHQFPKFKYWIFLCFWISFEFLQNFGEFSFPWFNIGYALAEYLPLLQIADLGGIYLLSLLIILVNVLLYRALKKFSSSLILLVILLFVWIGYGILRLQNLDMQKQDQKAAIVQVSIPQELKWEDAYFDSTMRLYNDFILQAAEKAKLVILPESAFPLYLLKDHVNREYFRSLAQKLDVDIFTGFPHYQKNEKGHPRPYTFFNSATQFSADGRIEDHYNKNILVPFGERIPFLKYFPFLWNIHLGQANWEYGKEQKFYDHDDFSYSPLICFEIAFERLTTRMMKNNPDFIVNITNDAWFHRSSGTYQHAIMTKFRAIETRRQLFRAANTGYSMVVSPTGEIQQISELFERTILTDNIITYSKKTIFTKFLSWFPYLFLIFSTIFLIASFVIRKK